MRTQRLSLDDDGKAMADLAEVPDWRPLWGPPATGPDAVRTLATRAAAATGWTPWPLTERTAIDPDQVAWGLVTPRDIEMLVLPDTVLPNCTGGGWSAYEIGPADLSPATAGLDEHWPAHLDRATTHWGPPVFAGRGDDSRIPETWRNRRRHLAVWLRPGAEFHLYADQPATDSATTTAGVSFSVYANEVS